MFIIPPGGKNMLQIILLNSFRNRLMIRFSKTGNVRLEMPTSRHIFLRPLFTAVQTKPQFHDRPFRSDNLANALM